MKTTNHTFSQDPTQSARTRNSFNTNHRNIVAHANEGDSVEMERTPDESSGSLVHVCEDRCGGLWSRASESYTHEFVCYRALCLFMCVCVCVHVSECLECLGCFAAKKVKETKT